MECETKGGYPVGMTRRRPDYKTGAGCRNMDLGVTGTDELS